MKTIKRNATATLEKGQLWKIDQAHVKIVDLGRSLAHYCLLKNAGQKGAPVRLGNIRTLQRFLIAHKARLVKTAA